MDADVDSSTLASEFTRWLSPLVNAVALGTGSEYGSTFMDLAPFRADHVGSLLRPARLHSAREDHRSGRISAQELRAIEDNAIRQVVAMQAAVGLQSATDGEFRRASWHMDFIYQLGGVSSAPDEPIKVRFSSPGGQIEFTTAALYVDGPIRLPETIFADDFAFLKEVAGAATPKLTIPSPSMVHYRGGPAALDPKVYPSEDQFWTDLSAAYAQQVRGVYDLGCRYLQLDDTSLAYLNDPAQRAELSARGDDAEHQHLRYLKQINAAIADRPADLRVTTHMCRGNFRSSWAASGGYDFVAEALFSELAVDGFFLEYDDERSGSFAPLRFVPPGKLVVLGLVTTKRGELESKDTLKRRIDEAAKYVPLEQLCLSPQCGFSSTVEGNTLTYDEQVAKLTLIVETAAEVWG
jgi:methionine synthase II (cobalamin-independent)